MAEFEDDPQDDGVLMVQTIKVWDVPVRLFHWLLVVSIIGAYVTHKLGVDYFGYHLWFGYLAVVLVLFRMVWGIVGTHHARFTNFIAGPTVVKQYLKKVIAGNDTRYAGHNPVGALMVVTLLLGMLVQALSGLFATDEIFNIGPLYAYVSEDLSLRLTSLHRQLFYWIVGAIFFHVLAVVLHGVFKKDNLVKAMITGKKSFAYSGETSINSSKIILAAVIVIVVCGILYGVVSLSMG